MAEGDSPDRPPGPTAVDEGCPTRPRSGCGRLGRRVIDNNRVYLGVSRFARWSSWKLPACRRVVRKVRGAVAARAVGWQTTRSGAGSGILPAALTTDASTQSGSWGSAVHYGQHLRAAAVPDRVPQPCVEGQSIAATHDQTSGEGADDPTDAEQHRLRHQVVEGAPAGVANHHGDGEDGQLPECQPVQDFVGG